MPVRTLTARPAPSRRTGVCRCLARATRLGWRIVPVANAACTSGTGCCTSVAVLAPDMSRSGVAHAATAVRPIEAGTPPRAAVIAAPSFGMIPPSRVPPPSSSVGGVDVDRVDDLAVEDQPVDVGEEEQPVGAERRPRSRRRPRRRSRSAARRRSARPPGSGPASSAAHDLGRAATGSGRRRGRAPGPASRARPISSPKSGTARSPIAAQSAALTAASEARTISIPSGVVTRRPPTNSTGMPGALHLGADLRAGAVDDAHLVPRAASSSTCAADSRGDGAADLDDEPAHVR